MKFLNWERLDYPQRIIVLERLKEGAKSNSGYYFLVALSAIVSMLGLLLNSSAVIIGGMIIAPLLYPIMAVGGGIVVGEQHLIRRSVWIALKGIAVAVVVAFIVALLSPISEPTAEILARTKPTLIDLVIALASGAAGAYAVAVRERLTAITGVVVAAALVPPISIVGYGLATASYGLVGGASLLFIANLIAVVVATVVVFYSLGFKPGRAQEKKVEAKRDFAVSMFFFIIIFGLLSVFLFSTISDARRIRTIEHGVSQFLLSYDDTTVVSIREEKTVLKTNLLTVTIQSPSLFTQRAVSLLDQQLEAQLKEPIDLQIILIPATKIVDEN